MTWITLCLVTMGMRAEGDRMRWLLIGTMLALMIALVVGHAAATDDSKVKSAIGHVETGTEKAARDGRSRS